MTTRLRSVNVSKGLPVNYCSGFRSLNSVSSLEGDGLYNLACHFFTSCSCTVIISLIRKCTILFSVVYIAMLIIGI